MKTPPRVQVYFVGGEDRKLLHKMNVLSKKYNISASKIGLFAIRKALPKIQKQLEGLSPDFLEHPEKQAPNT